MDKNELVSIFYKTVVPMPQRKYRMNRRGKMMTKHQIIMAKRKRSYNEANAKVSFESNEVTSIYSKQVNFFFFYDFLVAVCLMLCIVYQHEGLKKENLDNLKT